MITKLNYVTIKCKNCGHIQLVDFIPGYEDYIKVKCGLCGYESLMQEWLNEEVDLNE